ncbi:hypothetical protein GB937_001339 [Aspergillus fischeri]|nr:hypothetical protein GB937_001339 [Aspergillus fischeri]
MQSSFQSRVEQEEQSLEAYREERYQGSARVRLDCLSFDKGFSHLMNDGRNSIRLERILEIQGCLRINRDYHVPVLGSPYSILRDGEWTLAGAGRPVGYPRKWLSPQNRWWVVDVYVEDQRPDNEGTDVDQPGRRQLGARLVRSLREQFRNERQPPDGLIYYKLRLYEGALDQPADRDAADKWWAILQNNPATKKHKYLRAFFRHGSFPQAFDALLPIRGLWAGMQIGVLHTLVSLRCDEEILSYLEYIRHTFVTRIFGDDMGLVAGADAASVEMLQSRAPKVSNRDLSDLQKQMRDGTLFPSIQDSEKRDAVWNRLQTIDVPIPTLKTFFSDLRYLAVARKVMRTLLQITNPKTKVSIDEKLGDQHRMVGRLPLGEGKRVVQPGLRELWRFSFQYGLEMTGTARRPPRDQRTQEAAAMIPDSTTSVDRTTLWQHFFWLADQEGFGIPSLGDFGAGPMHPPGVPTPANSPEVWVEEEPVSRRRERGVTPTLIRQAQFRAFFRHLGGDTRDGPTTNPPESRAPTPPVGTFVSEDTLPPNPTERHSTSPSLLQDVSDIANPFWDMGMDMWGNELPLWTFRVLVNVPYHPERTIEIPSVRARVIEFLDGLKARGFVFDVAGVRMSQSVDIYEWHYEHPFDCVQAMLSHDAVMQYDAPSENRSKRRRRDPDSPTVQGAVSEIMAWIHQQVQSSVVEEEI